MNKNIISEAFNFKVGQIKKKDGNMAKIAFIDSKTSENTFNHKDKIKNDFGAYWDGYNKRWFWYLSDDPQKTEEIVKSKIEPCIDYLVSIEQNEDGNVRTNNEVKDAFNTLIKQIDQLIVAQTSEPVKNQVMSFDEIKENLKKYKEELVNALNNDEFKKMLEPVIAFRQNQGHRFSFVNSILSIIQDPTAKLVKSMTGWKQYNRVVKPGSPAIALFVPVSYENKMSDLQKERIITDYLNKINKKRLEDLTSGEKDELRVILQPQGGGGFKLVASFYDIRFTTVMEGKEDGAKGYDAIDNIPWFSDGEENEDTVRLYDAATKVIKSMGLELKIAKDLGGARGVSKSGSIDALEGKKNAGSAKTLIHELSHELLHQSYLKKQGEEYANYFVGKAEGRAVVEQQAEVSAWLVMKSFGYDIKESLNYVGIWGIDENKAVRVFDTVANVSSMIAKRMQDMLNMNESVMKLNEITGWDVAQLCGTEAMEMYKQNQEKNIQQTKNEFFENYNKLIKKY